MSRQQPRPYCRQGWTLRLLFLAKKPSPARGARVLQTAHPLYNELGFILITCKAHQPVIPSPVILNREEPAQGWFGVFFPLSGFLSLGKLGGCSQLEDGEVRTLRNTRGSFSAAFTPPGKNSAGEGESRSVWWWRWQWWWWWSRWWWWWWSRWWWRGQVPQKISTHP